MTDLPDFVALSGHHKAVGKGIGIFPENTAK
jgi:hypothetical protein